MTYGKIKHPDLYPSNIMYFSDDMEELRDGAIVETNGDLRLIRDEETGEELYRFQHEILAA
jgi:hypothetical protein